MRGGPGQGRGLQVEAGVGPQLCFLDARGLRWSKSGPVHLGPPGPPGPPQSPGYPLFCLVSPTRRTSKQPGHLAANSWPHGGGKWLVQTWMALPSPTRTHWRQNREVDQIGQLGNGPPRTSRVEEAAFGTDTGSDLSMAPEHRSTFYIPMKMSEHASNEQTRASRGPPKGSNVVRAKDVELQHHAPIKCGLVRAHMRFRTKEQHYTCENANEMKIVLSNECGY